MKRFLIKVYEKDWTFKHTIKENKLMSDIDFDIQKNWWQGQLNILLNEDFNYTWISKSDFIKVFLYDTNFPNWKLIYTWIIEEINRNYKQSENTIEYVCRWLASLLTRIYYNQSWYTFTKTDTASNIIKSVITYFNSVYSGNWLNTDWVVDTTSWNISIDFDYTSCFDVINTVQEVYWSFWYIDETWTCYFNTTPSQIYLTAWKDVQNIDINEDGSEIINKVIVNYNWWTYTDTDATSITNNWLFEKEYSKNEFWLTEATDFATEILNNNQTKQVVSIEVNNKYIFENLKVWDNLKVRNIDYLINSTIEKINYNVSSAVVYLDWFNSIGKVIKDLK